MRIQRGHVCVSGSGKQQLCLIPRNLYEGCSEQLEKNYRCESPLLMYVLRAMIYLSKLHFRLKKGPHEVHSGLYRIFMSTFPYCVMDKLRKPFIPHSG